jgi:hypothetical protein
MNSTKTPGQKFAEQYGSKAVEEMLSAIKWAKRLGLAITLLVMVASFQHQFHFLGHAAKADPFSAAIIPLAMDMFILLCVKVLSAAGMAAPAKKMALILLVFPVGVSATINFLGSATLVLGFAFIAVVLLIAGAEILKSLIKPDFKAILAEESNVQVAREVGAKRSKVEQDAINEKARLTRERNRVLGMRLADLRYEAADMGLPFDGLKKTEIQAMVIKSLELQTVAPKSPVPLNV